MPSRKFCRTFLFFALETTSVVLITLPARETHLVMSCIGLKPLRHSAGVELSFVPDFHEIREYKLLTVPV
jgi:hypothetical protein